ncbi:MAG: hypothetical protein GXP52_01705 [Deltaproteobacteria bacterium]|nr:hypothetical protein [Deltaproteobacteria bacterium]
MSCITCGSESKEDSCILRFSGSVEDGDISVGITAQLDLHFDIVVVAHHPGELFAEDIIQMSSGPLTNIQFSNINISGFKP